VVQHLEHRGVATFWPHYQERKPNRHVVERALFPGYLFVHIDPDDRLPTLSTPGVAYLVGQRDTGPTVIDDQDIERIRLMLTQPELIDPEMAEPATAGECVVVIDGPLRGLTGVYRERKGRGQVVVEMQMLGQARAVDVEAGWVRKLGGAAQSDRAHICA